MNTDIQIKPNGWQAWFLATRPKTLTAAVFPIIVGTVLAYPTGIQIQWALMGFALLCALFIQIGMNLINDAIDFKKGADTNLRLGPQRVTQNGWLSSRQVLTGGFICLFMAAVCGIPLVAQGGIPLLILLSVSICLAYCYTGGPLPISYYGLGELFVFLFYGLASTCVPYYLQTEEISVLSLLAGTQIGCLAVVILAINNLRDVVEDTQSQKLTMAVRFGKNFARWEITIFSLAPFLLLFLWAIQGSFFIGFLPFLVLPLSLKLVFEVWHHEPGKIYNQFLGMSALLHCAFGLLLILGIYGSAY